MGTGLFSSPHFPLSCSMRSNSLVSFCGFKKLTFLLLTKAWIYAFNEVLKECILTVPFLNACEHKIAHRPLTWPQLRACECGEDNLLTRMGAKRGLG